jgi:hypothetical protein
VVEHLTCVLVDGLLCSRRDLVCADEGGGEGTGLELGVKA